MLLEPVNPQRARIAQARAEQVEAERERQVMEHNLQDQYRRRLQSQRDRERNRLRKIEADEERACVLAQERREAVQRQAVYEENRRIRKVEAEKLKVDMSKLSWLDSGSFLPFLVFLEAGKKSYQLTRFSLLLAVK